MNAMSLSPVKPPLNPGNLAVPSATATNLTKPSLPANNNYNPLNLVPEGKGATSVSVSSTGPEKSIDLCSKPVTSNGSVSPFCGISGSLQNCNEKTESAENLTTNNLNSKSENIVEDSAKAKMEFEEKKDDKKPNFETKATSADNKATSDKDPTAQSVNVNEVVATFENSSAKKEDIESKSKDEKKTEAANRVSENVPVGGTTISPLKKESITELTVTKTAQEETKTANIVSATTDEKKDGKIEPESTIGKKTEPDAIAETVPMVVSTEHAVKTATSSKATKRKAKTPVESIVDEDSTDSRKSKRTRLPTQPYQSPIPELQLIAKLNTSAKTAPKTLNEKIIAFYKNEFLAVRNPEGSFYICQAFQNIHRSSTKIKIRWFTNLPQNIYTPDFYDTTEFDCILTNVTMTRVEKDRWKLPDHEHTRIENILKRALDVEKGVAEQPSVTEEHPDGLDLSLYKDEAQLQKKSKKKRAATSPKNVTAPDTKKTKTSRKAAKVQKATPITSSAVATKKSPRVSSYVNRDSIDVKTKAADKSTKKEKKEKKKKKNKASKKQVNSAASKTEKVTSKTWEPSVKASNSSKVVLSLKKEESSVKNAPTEMKVSKRTSNVSQKASAAATALAAAATVSTAKRRREEPKSTPSNTTPSTTERTGKVRNAGSAVAAKINSAAMRTAKEKERKTTAAVNPRKK